MDDKDKIRKVFMFFAVIGLYLHVTAIFEHFQLRSLVFPKYIMNSNIGIHWGRARGPFLSGSINGAVMGIVNNCIKVFQFNYERGCNSFRKTFGENHAGDSYL